jgi:hypothetical protein
MDLIAQVQSQLAEHNLTDQTVKDIDTLQDQQLQEAIYNYLKPLLKTASDKRTQIDSGTNSQEDTLNIKMGAALKAVTFGISQTDKDTISKTPSNQTLLIKTSVLLIPMKELPSSMAFFQACPFATLGRTCRRAT